jgi:hypothetical protein
MGQPQEIAINTLPFWSRFTLVADLRYNGVDPQRLLFTKGQEIAVFDYRRGESGVAPLNQANATARDTIQTKAGQTRGGSQYRIHGISITKDGYPYSRLLGSDGEPVNNELALTHQLWPPSTMQSANGTLGPQVPTVEDFRGLDSFMYELLQKFFRMTLQVDGTKRLIEFGPTILYPGVGGPLGYVDTTNGGTMTRNFMMVPEGIVWNPSGAVDSNMVMLLEAAYNCLVPTWTTPNGTASGGPISPQNPVLVNANPTALGRVWEQGWIMNFHGREESPTSNVS